MSNGERMSSDKTPRVARELTSSKHDAQSGDPIEDPVYQETRRNVLRFGNVAVAVVGLAIFLPLIVGVAQGISSQQVWDPYTGAPIYPPEGVARSECVERARLLLLEAGNLSSLKRSWAEPQREWQMRCRARHPDLSEALQSTRDALWRHK